MGYVVCDAVQLPFELYREINVYRCAP